MKIVTAFLLLVGIGVGSTGSRGSVVQGPTAPSIIRTWVKTLELPRE